MSADITELTTPAAAATADVHDHDHEHDHEEEEDSQETSRQSRAEKKVRKAIEKLGLKTITGATRVTLRAGRTTFVIDKPDVFKSPSAEVYVIFGEAKPEDQFSQLQQLASQKLGAMGGDAGAFGPQLPTESAAKEEEDDGEPEEAGDIPEDSIQSVMSNVNCSRNKAIRALKQAGGVVVDAIIALTE